MKKKLIVPFVAVLLILIIAGAAFGKTLLDKYSYSTEQADLDEYFHVSGDRLAIILQDARIEEQALLRNGVCYFDLDTVHAYMNEVFYADRGEGLLLYTDALGTVSAGLEGNTGEYIDRDGTQDLGHPVCFVEDDVIWLAADYVRMFTNYSYEVFERQVQVYTAWGEAQTAKIQKDTAVRLKGGIKSPVLRELSANETVEILEQMDEWSKVKTSDAIIGYVENKRMDEIETIRETPVADYVAPEYAGYEMEGKVCLGFHSIGATIGNTTFYERASSAKGMNVIAPTWFSLCDELGNFRSFGEASYVEKAHKAGLQVWGVLDNFNYRNETKESVKEYEVLSVTSKRQKLVNGIVNAAINLGLDGINIDFEQIASDTGIHYVQFLRELSVACRQNDLVLSVDDYVPFHFNEHYRLDIQGQVADYVIIMGYDEHWHGSGDPGSVSSISYVTNGIEKTISEVPAKKVINALPFYTIVWTTNGAKVTDEYLTMNNTPDFLKQFSTKPEWDETTCQNYLEWNSASGFKQVWLEDADSIRVKLNVMSANEIGGVAVWRLGYGTDAVWELIRAYVEF
ncbi:MAG: SH3 domain-containing protein [Lachnospiraceae bacterium]|nr:SH3 domain-containing protein [Lachnospiraceae bacterium]